LDVVAKNVIDLQNMLTSTYCVAENQAPIQRLRKADQFEDSDEEDPADNEDDFSENMIHPDNDSWPWVDVEPPVHHPVIAFPLQDDEQEVLPLDPPATMLQSDLEDDPVGPYLAKSTRLFQAGKSTVSVLAYQP